MAESFAPARGPPVPDELELTNSRLPARLADLPNPPRVLYLRGELPRGPAVAVVGTRKPTADAARFAHELAGELAAAGVTVLSGGAEGIDASAHRGALAVGGVTVVVAPSGFEQPFPEFHGELFRRIVRHGGAHLSLWRSDVKASEHNFFLRNRVMVALAHAVVVVEAPFRSGARNTAKHARRLGRPLFVVPSVPWNPKGAGCILELGLGARPLSSARDVMALLETQRLHAVVVPQRVVSRSARTRASDGSTTPSHTPSRSTTRSAEPNGTDTRLQKPKASVTRTQEPNGSRTRKRKPDARVTQQREPDASSTCKRKPDARVTQRREPDASSTRNRGRERTRTHRPGAPTVRARPLGSNPAEMPSQESEFLGPRTSSREEERVVSAIREGASHPDAISARTGLEVGRVQAAILTLTLRGGLVLDSAGRFKLISH